MDQMTKQDLTCNAVDKLMHNKLEYSWLRYDKLNECEAGLQAFGSNRNRANIQISQECISAARRTQAPRDAHLHVALDEVERRDSHVREPAAGDASGRTRRVESRRVHLDPPPRLTRRPRPHRGPRCRSGRRRGYRESSHATGGAKRGGGSRGRVKEAGEQRVPRALGEGHGTARGLVPSVHVPPWGWSQGRRGGRAAASPASAAALRLYASPPPFARGEGETGGYPGC
jgi:hypothetical protein